jgi:hypothetical protein
MLSDLPVSVFVAMCGIKKRQASAGLEVLRAYLAVRPVIADGL